MKMMLIKLLMRLVDHPLPPSKFDQKRMDEWLIGLSATNSGYKDYYTVRKRAIQDAISIGVGEREYWVLCGRLLELKQMSAVSNQLLKKEYVKEDAKKSSKPESGTEVPSKKI